MAKKEKEEKVKKQGRRKKRRGGVHGQILGLFAFITAVVFMPTTIMLFLGMLPTLVAGLVDRSGRGTKALTVGSMNLAGCTPFLLDLWTTGHTAENALSIISDPRTVIVIYCAAGIGYLIDWAMSGIVATIMIQRSGFRLKEIKRRQAELVERWGQEVTGTLPLDAYGFPIEKADERSADQASAKARLK